MEKGKENESHPMLSKLCDEGEFSNEFGHSDAVNFVGEISQFGST